jgi:hypothetical protein
MITDSQYGMALNRKFIICALLKYAIHFTDGDMCEQSLSVIGAVHILKRMRRIE